jgi:uncharacterized phage protein (TIGR01671 family)
MRKIKFRAWDKNNNKMRFDALPFNTNAVCFAYGDGDNTFYTTASLERNPMEFMQYTGLKDKNGKEVYEGDIVKTRSGNFKVVYKQKFAGWYIEKPDGHREFLSPLLGNEYLGEVIGNIYETPELIGS